MTPIAAAPMPSPPLRANVGLSKGMGRILPQVRPDLSGLGRLTLKVAASVLLLAAIGGAAMVGKLKWDDFMAARRIGTATFASVPSGAQVFVDGQPMGTTPVQVELPIGRHDVELRLKGQKRAQGIEVVHGQDVQLAIDWRAKPTGVLQLTSNPSGAKVIVDGRPRGVTPLTLRDLVVGQHTVVFDSSQGTVKRQITVSEGKTETLAESIFSGWLTVTAPIEVTLSEGARPLQLDSSNRVFLRPGVHEITAQNKELGFSLTQTIEILPGLTANLDISTQDSTISVNGPSGATVYIDGERAGEIPLVNHQVKIGSRDIRVVDRSGAAYHITVNVTKSPAQVNVDFSKP